MALLPLGPVGLQALQLDARLLELIRLGFRLGTMCPLVFLQITNAVVSLRKVCFRLAESAAREAELLLELCLKMLSLRLFVSQAIQLAELHLPFAQSAFELVSTVPC
ncbi:MAG: hypothetical protein E6G50_09470 [Actinobacteria bacterium]|nr:MAG: hypothetical protein E6G50_09470 [Actinomycetota bacterium]